MNIHEDGYFINSNSIDISNTKLDIKPNIPIMSQQFSDKTKNDTKTREQ